MEFEYRHLTCVLFWCCNGHGSKRVWFFNFEDSCPETSILVEVLAVACLLHSQNISPLWQTKQYMHKQYICHMCVTPVLKKIPLLTPMQINNFILSQSQMDFFAYCEESKSRKINVMLVFDHDIHISRKNKKLGCDTGWVGRNASEIYQIPA